MKEPIKLQREGCHDHPNANHYDKAGLMRCTECEARAVEEERMANCKAVCERCAKGFKIDRTEDGRYIHGDFGNPWCTAALIYERSQVKGEGL